MGDGGCAVLSSRHPLAEFCNSEPCQREQLKSRGTTTLGTELGLSRLKGHSKNASAHEHRSSRWSPVTLSDMEHGSSSQVGVSSTERQGRRPHSRWDVRAEDIKIDVMSKGDTCKYVAVPLRVENFFDMAEKEQFQLVGSEMGGLNPAKELQQTRRSAGRVLNDVLNGCQLQQFQVKDYTLLHTKTSLKDQHCPEDQLCEKSEINTCMDCSGDDRAPLCNKQETLPTKGIDCNKDPNLETEQLEKVEKPPTVHSRADEDSHADYGIDFSTSVRTDHNLQVTVLHYNRRSKKGSKEKKSTSSQTDIGSCSSTITRSDCEVKDSEDVSGPCIRASNSLVTRDDSLHLRESDGSANHSFTISDSCARHHTTRPDELQPDKAVGFEPCNLKGSYLCEKDGKYCHGGTGDCPAENKSNWSNVVAADGEHRNPNGGEMQTASEDYSGHLHGTNTTTDDLWAADMDVPMDLSPAPAEDDASSSLINVDNFGLNELLASSTSDTLCGEPDSRSWIYLDAEGNTQGPVSLSLLKGYMRDGSLRCDHMVQVDGSNEWVTLEHAGLPVFRLGEALMQKRSIPSEVKASASVAVLDDSTHLSSQLLEDLVIDSRVDRLMQGSTLVPGSEKEAILGALRNEYQRGHQESEQQFEDEELSYSHADPFSNWSIDHYSCEEQCFQSRTSSLSVDDGAAEPFLHSAFRNSRLWTSRGGDWKLMSQQENSTNVKSSTGFGRPEKAVLNGGKPLRERMFHKLPDPRRGSSLYKASVPETLRLPPWAHHYWEAKGGYAITIPENLHTTSLVSTPRLHFTTPRDGPPAEGSREPKMSKLSSFSDRKVDEHPPSSLHRAGWQQLARSDHDEDVHGSSVCQDMEISPVREEAPLARVEEDPDKCQQVPTEEGLRLDSGDWFYQDGNGREKGPYSFSYLQSKVRKGVLYEGRSVYRKSDDTWVPIYPGRHSTPLSTTSRPSKDGRDGDGKVRQSGQEAGQGVLLDFHKLYPQFIGFMCGKLHEYVMKSYKGREFAAMVDEGTRICLSNKRSRRASAADVPAMEIKTDEDGSDSKHREDSFQDVPSSISASFFTVDHVNDGRARRMKSLADIDDGRPYSAVVETDGGGWSMLGPRLLMNVFRYLDTDIRSLAFASSTCRSWRATVVKFKREIKQVDFSSLGSLCSDEIFRSLTEHAGNVSRVILRGCTSLSPLAVKAYLQGLHSIEFVDTRGCDQLKDLMHIFPQICLSRNQQGGSDLHHTARRGKYSGGTLTGKHPRGSDMSSPDEWKAKRLSFTNGLMDEVVDPMDWDTSHSMHSGSEATQVGLSNDYKRLKLQSNGKLVKVGFDSSHSKTLSREYVLFARDRQITTSQSSGNEHKVDLFPAAGDRRLEKEMAQVLQFLKDARTSRSKKPSSLRCREMGLMKIEDKLRRGFYPPNLQGLRLFKSDLLDVARLLFRLKELEAGTIIFTNTFRLTDQLLQEFKGRGVLDSRPKDVALKSSSSLFGGKRGIGSSLKQSSGKRRRKAHEDETSEEDECDYSFSCKSGNSETDDDDDEVSQDEKDEDTDVSDSDVETESEGEGMVDRKKEVVLSGDEVDHRGWGARMTKASMVPPETRKYEVIEEYVIVADVAEVNKRMDVNLPEDYDEIVQAQEDRGIGYSHLEMPELREFKPRKHVQEEVLEQEVYGIDPYTHNLLMDSMPTSRFEFPDDKRHQLIEEDILKALNQEVRQFTGNGKAPTKFSLEHAVNRALEECTDLVKRGFIAALVKNMRARKESHMDTYHAYRKGLGVVCNLATGFDKDEFIVEFFGEVYPAWRWFEKQDAIRSFQKKDKDPAPEFYNIFLERPKGDTSGYDLVVVDAMHKANYASRICHSCRPNCEARVTAVNGRYQIGVYTLRPVEYGEELTFDYNSITESKEEHEKSVCLCGSSVCRGSYLNFAGPDTFQEIMKEDHHLLHRHDLLLRACIAGHATAEDWDVLKQAGLGCCLLDGLPGWTVKYAAEVVRFVNEERKFLPREITKTFVSERKLERAGEAEAFEAEIQADGVFNSRLQNLAITLDKVRYVFKKLYGNPLAAPPPLRMLKPAEVAALIWTGENSVVSDLLEGMAQHCSKEDFADFKRKVQDHEPSESGDIEKNLRRSLIWLRDQLCRAPIGCMSRHDAAADLIHIYAHTKFFFTCQDYPTFESPSLTISPLDLGPKHAHKLGTATSFEWSKVYKKDYVLGQLIFWYKLNDAEPGASLAKASWGCLVLPDPSSCYAKSTQQRVLYSSMDRLKMFQRMEHKQSRPWNWKGQTFWQFRNSRQLLGSPMMDSIHNGTSIDEEMMDWLKRRTRSF